MDFEDEVKSKSNDFFKMSRGKFKNYANWWIDEYKEVRPKTKSTYRYLLDSRIIPLLGNNILSKITSYELIDFINILKNTKSKKTGDPLSAITINHYHRVLSMMFNDAVTLNIIDDNPMKSVKKVIVPNKIFDNFYNKDELIELLKVLPTAPTKYQLITMLTLTGGTRLGEVTAPQWKHFDTDNEIWTIAQSNVHVDGKTIISDTKNLSSLRDIHYPSIITPLLEEHRKDEILKRKQLGDDWYYPDNKHEDDFVFTQANGKVMYKNTPYQWFVKFLERNKLRKITFHGLRHTSATFLFSTNQIDLKNLSARLGHSRTSTTTDIYAHMLKEVDEKAADVFDEFVEENEDKIKSGTSTGTSRPNLRIVK